VVFADAAAEWLRYIEVDRARKPSTIAGYKVIVRSQLLPAFGEMPIESITTPVVERWLASLGGAASSGRNRSCCSMGSSSARRRSGACSPTRSPRWRKPPLSRSGEIQVFSPEEVWTLVRGAESEQDAAVFLTAAFTGLRLGELLALRWRDVDFAGATVRVRASYTAGHETTPK
jgi:integrase